MFGFLKQCWYSYSYHNNQYIFEQGDMTCLRSSKRSPSHLRHNAHTWELFCWDFFEMYHKMTGSLAKLDQWNTSFVVILLGQTPAIGGSGRHDRADCRDMKQTCREVAHIERRLLQLGHSDNRRHSGRPKTLLLSR